MKRKLIPFFLSAAVLLTSCSSSGNKTTDGSTTASDVSQTVSGSNQAESVSSAEETEQADGLTKTLQIYDGIDIIKESCFRKTGMSHIFPKPHKYAIIESKKVLKKQHLKGEEKCRKSK